MNLDDARIGFKYGSKMIKRVKGNTSSAFRKNMNCRHCPQTEEETQEHLEICEGTRDLRVKLDLFKEHNHLAF